jgi:hypothetical protein
MRTKDAEQVLELLNGSVCLDLRLDELRIILTCMRAVEYQMELDDEPYLDDDGYALKRKLEELYRLKLR